MTYELTCINCPMGCRITADYDGKAVTNIQGYTCARGKAYAETEITNPTRMVTALVKVEGTHIPLCVKTSKAIEKKKIFDALTQLKTVTAVRPIHIGDVIIKGVCGSDADIVATEEIL